MTYCHRIQRQKAKDDDIDDAEVDIAEDGVPYRQAGLGSFLHRQCFELTVGMNQGRACKHAENTENAYRKGSAIGGSEGEAGDKELGDEGGDSQGERHCIPCNAGVGGKNLGTFMYLFSGGEPLMRKSDIIALCEAHPDCCFLAFTNGTLIDEAFASAMLRVKNLSVAISIEGDEAATDERRGKGTYAKAIKAMSILKRYKLLYGISCCYTSQNVQTIGSEAFIDSMLDLGAKFAWFFTYIPIGRDAVPSLMVSAGQRAFMYQQVRSFRKSKPIFTMDFWNDGEYVDGCIAGGRCYVHINAQGDIEPCAFIHYSDSNIYTTSLLDAFKRPLFQQYKERQPFNNNPLRPCPLLDNPEQLREMVHASGAVSTDLASVESVDDLTAKCDQASKDWAVSADRLWEDHATSSILCV